MAVTHGPQTESLIRGSAGRIFLTFTVVTLAGSVGRLVLSPLLPTILSDLNITRSAAGAGLTLMWACTALAQFPGGRFSDRLSRKTVLATGLWANVVGFGTLVLTESYAGFLWGLGLVGLGTDLFIPAKYLVLTGLFVNRRGRAFGVNSAAAETGGVLAAVVAVVPSRPMRGDSRSCLWLSFSRSASWVSIAGHLNSISSHGRRSIFERHSPDCSATATCSSYSWCSRCFRSSGRA